MNGLAKSLLVGIVIVSVYIFGSSILHPLSPKVKPVHLSRQLPDSPAQLAIWGLHLTETKGNKLLWELEADSAHMYQQQQSAQLENIKLTLYQEHIPGVQLEGMKASLNLDSRDVAIEGKVQASFLDGLTFETNSLNWWNQKRIISTPDPVKIAKSYIQLHGQGLEVDVDSERLRINHRVTTIIN